MGEGTFEGVEMIHGEQRQALGGEEDFVLEDGSMQNDGGNVVGGRLGGGESVGEVESARCPGQRRSDEVVRFRGKGRGMEHTHARALRLHRFHHGGRCVGGRHGGDVRGRRGWGGWRGGRFGHVGEGVWSQRPAAPERPIQDGSYGSLLGQTADFAPLRLLGIRSI